MKLQYVLQKLEIKSNHNKSSYSMIYYKNSEIFLNRIKYLKN